MQWKVGALGVQNTVSRKGLEKDAPLQAGEELPEQRAAWEVDLTLPASDLCDLSGPVCSSAMDAVIKHHRLGDLGNRNVLLHIKNRLADSGTRRGWG